jgi:CubicO group peptidase (beta-lactamase class C family)
MALVGQAITTVGNGLRHSSSTQFQAAFDKYVHEDAIVGAAYAVIENGHVLEWHQIGMADRDLNQPVTENTIFHWGSITKTLTAVAVMQLRDQGKVSLDDSITKYVPELSRVHSDYGPISQVTLRQLLSHSAGFQNPTWPYRDETKPWQPFEPTEWAQLVAMMPYQELAFRPGNQYSYSNPAFIYLARVIEKVSGLSYEEYVRQNFFKPLRMAHSYFNLSPPELAQNRSNNYTISITRNGHKAAVANGREFDTGITTPNGGLKAPIEDLVRWLTFLSGVMPDSDTILTRASLREMWSPVVTVKADPHHPQKMGLSFFLDERPTASGTITFVGHTGEQAGFRSFFVLNPRNGRAMIVAFNTSPPDGNTPNEMEYARTSHQGFNDIREKAFALLE